MGAAASGEPPPDVVEACVTLESGDVEEILSVFFAASCASPTNGFGGDASPERLARWRGEWWRWTRPCPVSTPTTRARARLSDFLRRLDARRRRSR